MRPKKEKIMLVDSSNNLRHVIKDYLEMSGFEVTDFRDGIEANEQFNKRRKLFFCWLEDGTYTFYHGGYDDLKGFSKGDICQFIREKVKNFSKCSFILTPSLFHSDHQISGKDDCYMCGQGII